MIPKVKRSVGTLSTCPWSIQWGHDKAYWKTVAVKWSVCWLQVRYTNKLKLRARKGFDIPVSRIERYCENKVKQSKDTLVFIEHNHFASTAIWCDNVAGPHQGHQERTTPGLPCLTYYFQEIHELGLRDSATIISDTSRYIGDTGILWIICYIYRTSRAAEHAYKLARSNGMEVGAPTCDSKLYWLPFSFFSMIGQCAVSSSSMIKSCLFKYKRIKFLISYLH